MDDRPLIPTGDKRPSETPAAQKQEKLIIFTANILNMGVIDLVLVTLFCYQLYKMASEKGLAPWPYVLNYIGLFMLLEVLFFVLLFSFFGKDMLQTEEGFKMALYFVPIPFIYETLLYFHFRKRIKKTEAVTDEDDYNPPPSNGKKDLSYFR